jgi:protoheme IX farnesyltransferase
MLNFLDRRFKFLTLTTAIATYLLVVLGGIVRVTGSGLGCLDWPLCAQPMPSAWMEPALEMAHRVAAGLVTGLVILVALVAWRRYRQQKWIFRPAMLGVATIFAQSALGAVTVLLKNAPYTVVIHLGTALAMFALTTIVAIAARQIDSTDPIIFSPRRNRLLTLSLTGALLVYLLILVGALVTATNSALACLDWPLCQGQVLPATTDPFVYLQWLHRLAALIAGLFLAWLTVETWRKRVQQPQVWIVAALSLSLYIVQVTIGAGNVLLRVPLVLRGLHLAVAAAVWASVVVLSLLAARKSNLDPVTDSKQVNSNSTTQLPAEPMIDLDRPPLRKVAGAYFKLTKPWVLILLLVTTFAAMLIAQRGLPSLPLVFFTLLGGALSASGASAINSYIDRDIDGLMSRTKNRPVPMQRIDADHALAFGLILSVSSFVILTVFVNLLSAILATIGLLFYVFVYTGWLKRSTPHNIVIGGLAGAIPPLVGWAAVTGRVEVTALYLFVIIFYWTPPHTWALMLLISTDYAKVGIPMLPVVRGDAVTRQQIVLYSVQLIAITLLLFAFQLMGWVYFFSALILNGLLLWLVIVLARDKGKAAAKRLYKFSQLYLALLFLAMVIDKVR